MTIKRLSGITRNTSFGRINLKPYTFNLKEKSISVAKLGQERLAKAIYGQRYNDFPFNEVYSDRTPKMIDISLVLGGEAYHILVSKNNRKTEYFVGISGDILRRREENRCSRTTLGRVGDAFFQELFKEVEPVLRHLMRQFPLEDTLGLTLRTYEAAMISKRANGSLR